MSRYIDADAVMQNIPNEEMIAKMIISVAPTIDIVRCSECKWADFYTTSEKEQFCYCLETDRGGRTAEDFCSYGERSDND